MNIIISISILILAFVIWKAATTLNSNATFFSGRLSGDLADMSRKLVTISEQLGIIARILENQEENASEKPQPLTPLQTYALAYIGSTCDELNRQKSIDLAYTTEQYVKGVITRDDQRELESTLRQCIALYVVAIMKLIIENPAAQVDNSQEREERFKVDINYLSDLHDGLKQLEASMEDDGERDVREIYLDEIERLEKASLIKPIETHAGDVLIGIAQAEVEWHIGEENKKNEES